MSNILAKQRLMKLQLFGIAAIIVFMFIPSTFGCVDFSVTLYTGASSTDALLMTDQEVSICKDDTAYFCAKFTGTNPDNHNLGWQIDYGNGDGWETKEITTYDAAGDYKIYPSPTTTKSDVYAANGERTPKIRVFYVNGSGDPINTNGDVVDISDDSVMSGADVSAKDLDSKVYVVKVDTIEYEKSAGTWVDATTSTLYVNKGSTVKFRAIPDPSTATSWPSGKPVWGGTSGATSPVPPDDPGDPISVTFNTVSSSSTDYKTVTADCGNTTPIKANIIVIGVDRITESGINDFGPIYIPLGDSITLQTYCDPPFVSWPSGQPVWSLTTMPIGSSLSSSLGSEVDTKVITPDVAGEYVIKTECGSSSDTLTLYAFDVEITTSTSTAMDITTTPTMPSVTFHADITPDSILSNVTFKWYLDMTFTHDKLGDLTNRIPDSGTSDVVGNEDWTPTWGSVLAGGNVKVYVTASVPRSTVQTTPGEYDDDQSGYKIKGTNPSQAEIFTVATTDAAKAICWKESSHRHFDATAYAGIGDPLPCYKRDGGYGLMMHTPSSEEQVWNWKTNLTDGITHMATAYAQSVQHLSNINDGDGPGSYTPNPDPTPDPPLTMTASQHWMNAYSLYRTGSVYYYDFQVVSGTEYEWVRNSGTGPDYADTIQGYIDSPPWP